MATLMFVETKTFNHWTWFISEIRTIYDAHYSDTYGPSLDIKEVNNQRTICALNHCTYESVRISNK
jgi:hypothetical protein